VTITGSLRTDPGQGAFGWFAILGAGTVVAGGREVSLGEAVWLQADGPVPAGLWRADRVRVSGTLVLPEAGDFASYLASKSIAVELKVHGVEHLGPSSNPLVRFACAARGLLRDSIGRLFDDKDAGLLMGLALGDTSGLDPGLSRDFRATGLGHLLAVSGENVVMVLAPMLGLASVLRMRPRSRFALGAITVLFFVVMTGAEPSVLRAGVMAGLTLTATLLGRPRSGWVVLGGAVLVLLLLEPTLTSSIGFQLSVVATCGMVALAEPISQRLARILPASISAALGTSLAAQLGVSPLLLYQFHWVPGATIPANLLAFPSVAPALVLGLAAAACGLLFRSAGMLLSVVARLPLHYLESLASRLAAAGVPSLTGGGWVVLAGGAALVVALAVWLRSGKPLPRKVIVLVATVMPVFVWGTALKAGPPSGLVVRFLDVGQGDATLITSPQGATVLIDGGPEPELAATKLAAYGVKRLDVVVATHAHADHVEGLPDVLSRYPVGVLLESTCRDYTPSYSELATAARDEHVKVERPSAGDVITVADITLHVLSPPSCFHDTNSDANNDSLVIRLLCGEDSVMFPGDAEQPAQDLMMESGGLASEVLKVPHHGGSTSDPAFFSAVSPELAVISVGQPNPYGHPSPEMLAVLQGDGIPYMRTDLSGDISVTFAGRGPTVESGGSI
jgi:competence protein ComEC